MICELIIYYVLFNIVINPFPLTVIIYQYDTINLLSSFAFILLLE